jgi:hypothetical protein
VQYIHVSHCYIYYIHASPCLAYYIHASPCLVYYIHASPCLVYYIHASPGLVYYIHVSPCLVYCSLLKSMDLTNREKPFKYLATSSLLVGGQIPPLVVICCIKELLWGSNILHAWITCSTDCSSSLQGTSGVC